MDAAVEAPHKAASAEVNGKIAPDLIPWLAYLGEQGVDQNKSECDLESSVTVLSSKQVRTHVSATPAERVLSATASIARAISASATARYQAVWTTATAVATMS